MLFRSRSDPFPRTFESSFLNDLAEAFQKRRKAISYHGVLEWETRPGDELEWLTVVHQPLLAIDLVVTFWEGNRANLLVRSRRGAEHGKVLLRLEDLLLPANGKSIVRAFEDTRALFHRHCRGDEAALARATGLWHDLSLAVEA